MRERWWGATGRRVPEISVEGELDLEGALVLDSVADVDGLKAAHAEGRPVAVRAGDVEALKAALARPEVATVVVPRAELRDVDLTELTYGGVGSTEPPMSGGGGSAAAGAGQT